MDEAEKDRIGQVVTKQNEATVLAPNMGCHPYFQEALKKQKKKKDAMNFAGFQYGHETCLF